MGMDRYYEWSIRSIVRAHLFTIYLRIARASTERFTFEIYLPAYHSGFSLQTYGSYVCHQTYIGASSITWILH